MPYVTKEHANEVRETLKKEFPDFKFSVSKHRDSTLVVAIMRAPFDLLPDQVKKYSGVNVYHIDSNFKDNEKTRALLHRVYAIANNGNRTITEDADYGSVPAFYVDITIGTYEKECIIEQPKTTQPAPAKQSIEAGKIQVIEYSERSIAVVGNTYPIRQELKNAGGKFNKFLSCGAGWIFSKSQLNELKELLQNLKQKEQPPQETGIQVSDQTDNEEEEAAQTEQQPTPSTEPTQIHAIGQTNQYQTTLF